MRKFRHVYVEVWSENVYFIKCTAAMFKKALRDEFHCEPHIPICPITVGQHGIYTDPADGIPVYVVWVSEWASLTHELMHCVVLILKNKGLWLDDCSEEAYAYLLTYLDNNFRKGSQ